MRFYLDMEDEDIDEFDDALFNSYKRQARRRYIYRAKKYKSRDVERSEKLKQILESDFYTDDQFKAHFRVCREMFWAIYDRIKDDEIFRPVLKKPKSPISLHLLILLKFLGSNGNEASTTKHAMFFRVSKGCFTRCLERMVEVMLKHKDEAVFWPGVDERREISKRIEERHGFPNCVGLIDGTLFPLEAKPPTNGEEYFTRKCNYAVNCLITCDDVARIRDIVIGWPGSVHDNRVWTTSKLYAERDSNFSLNKYLLGDSAFEEGDVMIPAFKKPRGAAFPRAKEFFNTLLAKPRVKSEHCNGILKGRFQYLKRIRVLIYRAEDMRKIINYVYCAAILHNWLIEDPIPQDWVDLAGENDEDEHMNAMAQGNEEDSRRTRMLGYILEKFNFY